MTVSDRDLDILRHIMEYCCEVEETRARFGDQREIFLADKIYRNAGTMCILQIGELAAHLSDHFTAQYSLMPWRAIKDMRNMAAHAYGSMSPAIIWDTMIHDIPQLKAYCESILL